MPKNATYEYTPCISWGVNVVIVLKQGSTQKDLDSIFDYVKQVWLFFLIIQLSDAETSISVQRNEEQNFVVHIITVAGKPSNKMKY